MRRPADRLDPADLHGRLGQRGLRRREPALLNRCGRAEQAHAGAREVAAVGSQAVGGAGWQDRAITSTAAKLLQDRLGLTDDELLAVLEASPLQLVGGDLEHRPELAILLALTGEAAERVHADALRRWLRTAGPAGRPLDHLLRRDFAAFEDALDALAERGFVVRRAT